MDEFASVVLEELEALLRAGPLGCPVGPPPERLTFTGEERGLLDRLTHGAPNVVHSMAGDVAETLRRALPALQPLIADAGEIDDFLVAVVDQVVDCELKAGEPWGDDEPERRMLLDLLARHCVSLVREQIAKRLIASHEH